MGDACFCGAGFGGDAQARCWSAQSKCHSFPHPKDFPTKQTQASGHIFLPHITPGHPAGGAELSGSHPSCLHQASLLSLRGCEAEKAGAGSHCPNLPRLVLFQQDFQVPAVAEEPRRAGLGWARLQRAQHEPGWELGSTDPGHGPTGIVWSQPPGLLPGAPRVEVTALSSPAREVMGCPRWGDGGRQQRGPGDREVLEMWLCPQRFWHELQKELQEGGSCVCYHPFVDDLMSDGAVQRDP